MTRGNIVRFWQTVLYSTYYEPAGVRCWFVDGSFGSGTRDWTEKWQDSSGLTADGWVGDNTWAKLRSYLDVTTSNQYHVTYKWQPSATYGSPTIYVDYAIATGKWRYKDLCDGGVWKPIDH